MPVIRIVYIILVIVLVVSMLQACNTQGRIQKELDAQFLDYLSLGKTIDEVQAHARSVYGEELNYSLIPALTLLYYCYENNACYPDNLPELLTYKKHWVYAKSDDESRFGLHEIPQSELWAYNVAERKLNIMRFRIGGVRRNIEIFFNDESSKVVGWISGGDDPIKER